MVVHARRIKGRVALLECRVDGMHVLLSTVPLGLMNGSRGVVVAILYAPGQSVPGSASADVERIDGSRVVFLLLAGPDADSETAGCVQSSESKRKNA